MKRIFLFVAVACLSAMLLPGAEAGQSKKPSRQQKTVRPQKSAPKAQGGTRKVVASMQAESMTAEDSQAFLGEMNTKRMAFPESYMFGLEYKKIEAASCFGVRLVNGKRLAGESAGRSYGISGTKFRGEGKGARFVVIGAIYSEFPFSIQGEALPAGPYVVHAYRDALELTGDDRSTMRYDHNRRKEVPAAKTVTFPLKLPLAPEMVTEDAKEVPRFTLDSEGGAIVLSLGENRWPLVPQVGS